MGGWPAIRAGQALGRDLGKLAGHERLAVRAH